MIYLLGYVLALAFCIIDHFNVEGDLSLGRLLLYLIVSILSWVTVCVLVCMHIIQFCNNFIIFRK